MAWKLVQKRVPYLGLRRHLSFTSLFIEQILADHFLNVRHPAGSRVYLGPHRLLGRQHGKGPRRSGSPTFCLTDETGDYTHLRGKACLGLRVFASYVKVVSVCHERARGSQSVLQSLPASQGD